jgi:hypothetical protein
MVSASALWLPTKNRDQISDPSLSPHWGFWATLFWSLLIVIVFFIAQLLALLIPIVSSYHNIYFWLQFEAELQSAAYNGNALAYATFMSATVPVGWTASGENKLRLVAG